MDVKSVGQNIKEIREKKKITQKRLAELSGRGESAISNYESAMIVDGMFRKYYSEQPRVEVKIMQIGGEHDT